MERPYRVEAGVAALARPLGNCSAGEPEAPALSLVSGDAVPVVVVAEIVVIGPGIGALDLRDGLIVWHYFGAAADLILAGVVIVVAPARRFARAEAVSGNAARLAGTPTPCPCKIWRQDGVAARILFVLGEVCTTESASRTTEKPR